MPYVIFNTFVFTCLFYWMVGMNADVGVFFFWYLCFLLYVLFYTFFGFLMGCLMPDVTTATAVCGVFTSVGGLLSGFMLPRSEIPWWWRWLSYATPISYALQASTSTQFYCAAAEAAPHRPGDCPTFEMANRDGTTETVVIWLYIRDAFDLVYADRWMYLGILLGCMVAARVASGLVLQFVNHSKR